MIYSLSLRSVMLVVGLLLVAGHLLALVRGPAVQAWLRAFPRNKPAGVILTIVATLWFYLLIKFMDLGEFTRFKGGILTATPIAGVLAIFFMQEFLAVRALGTVALLAVQPALDSAFLRGEPIRLAVVALVYVWAVLGMFWVGMPYTLRDQVGWVTASGQRWRGACLGGLAYGALVAAGSLFVG